MIKATMTTIMIFGMEVTKLSEKKALKDLPLVFSPNCVLCSLMLEYEDVLDSRFAVDSIGSSPNLSRSPILINTSSRLADRMLYCEMLRLSKFASTFLNISVKNSPSEFGTVYTVMPDSSIFFTRGLFLYSVLSKYDVKIFSNSSRDASLA